MAKLNVALFSSVTFIRTDVDANGNNVDVVQPTLTLVTETSGTKRYASATFCFDKDTNEISVVNVSLPAVETDGDFLSIIKCFGVGVYNNVVVQPIASIKPTTDTTLLFKLDLALRGKNFKDIFNSGITLGTKDSNGLKLNDFLSANFSFNADDIYDYKKSKNVLRKFALPKKQLDFSEFWNSPYITEAEKDYCRSKIDLDVCMSNSKKLIYKVLRRTIFTDYPERIWVSNIFFGDPSSGKTTMVSNFASLESIPMVKLTGDLTISLTKILMVVGPERVEKTKDSIIKRLKDAGYSDQAIAQFEDDIAKALIDNTGSVELTLQESIILKAIIYNLPLMIFLDEINLFKPEFQATLADVITSGYINVGVHTYKCDPSKLIWIGAYNPDTYKAAPFEGKFRDRALFFCSEMPTQEELVAHKQRKNAAKIFGCSAALTAIETKLEELKAQYPEQASKLDECYNNIVTISQSSIPSSEAINWYFDYCTSKVLGTDRELTFKEGEFTDYYIGDVQMDTVDSLNESTNRIIKLVDKINEQLASLTKGIDSKNPNNEFCFYIPNRAVDYFTDLIFCLTSVKEATKYFIYNLIPNGNTCTFGTTKNPANVIADQIVTSLSVEINDLQDYLFTDFDKDAADNAIFQAITNAFYDVSAWTPKTINSNGEDIVEAQTVTESTIEVTDTSANDTQKTGKSDDILDEAEDI